MLYTSEGIHSASRTSSFHLSPGPEGLPLEEKNCKGRFIGFSHNLHLSLQSTGTTFAVSRNEPTISEACAVNRNARQGMLRLEFEFQPRPLLDKLFSISEL